MGLVSWADRFGPGWTLADHARKFPSSVGDRTAPRPSVADGVNAVARVSGGHWIARCPIEGCAGREYVNMDELLFFCCECRNGAVDHQLIRVKVPDAKRRATIEQLLTARPAPATRNWRPDETVTFLRSENRAHGIKEATGGVD